ncbi:unnamed protein product [Peniophora sp. CBMAI 1063]|nr:unnamed protein product [Peniophora sp. CBMAI 1063]
MPNPRSREAQVAMRRDAINASLARKPARISVHSALLAAEENAGFDAGELVREYVDSAHTGVFTVRNTRSRVTEEDKAYLVELRSQIGLGRVKSWVDAVSEAPHHRDKPEFWRHAFQHHKAEIVARVNALRRPRTSSRRGAAATPSRRNSVAHTSRRARPSATSSRAVPATPQLSAREARQQARTARRAHQLAAAQPSERSLRHQARALRAEQAARDAQVDEVIEDVEVKMEEDDSAHDARVDVVFEGIEGKIEDYHAWADHMRRIQERLESERAGRVGDL